MKMNFFYGNFWYHLYIMIIMHYNCVSLFINFVHIKGSTPTPLTGPSQAAEGNYYFYYEGHSSGSTARLISRAMKTGNVLFIIKFKVIH